MACGCSKENRCLSKSKNIKVVHNDGFNANNNWTCWKVKGHTDKEHVACNSIMHNMASWPNENYVKEEVERCEKLVCYGGTNSSTCINKYSLRGTFCKYGPRGSGICSIEDIPKGKLIKHPPCKLNKDHTGKCDPGFGESKHICYCDELDKNEICGTCEHINKPQTEEGGSDMTKLEKKIIESYGQPGEGLLVIKHMGSALNDARLGDFMLTMRPKDCLAYSQTKEAAELKEAEKDG